MMEEVVTSGAIKRAKLQSNKSPPTNQHPTFLQARMMPFLSKDNRKICAVEMINKILCEMGILLQCFDTVW